MSIEHTAEMSPMKVTPDYLTRVFRDTYRDDPRAWLRVAAKICPALTVGEALDLLENRAEFQAAGDETVIVVPCEAEPAPEPKPDPFRPVGLNGSYLRDPRD